MNMGGHSGRADDYHYHIAPMHLEKISNNGPIAYALDGFPIYGFTEANGSPMLPLDEHHGHTAATGDASTSAQGYHYHATLEYPYFIGNMVGVVSIEPEESAETEIVPQSRSNGVRDATEPLQGATITNFTRISEQSFKIDYTVSSQANTVYSIEYSWDNDRQNFSYKFLEDGEETRTEEYSATHEDKKSQLLRVKNYDLRNSNFWLIF